VRLRLPKAALVLAYLRRRRHRMGDLGLGSDRDLRDERGERSRLDDGTCLI
jgi:hypothetical protein